MKRVSCERCGVRVFFENVECGACKAQLGFIPEQMTVGAFEAAAGEPAGQLQRLSAIDAGAAHSRCANHVPPVACNWIVSDAATDPLCVSCRTTEIFPALDKPENGARWARIEAAKRRMVYGLLSVQLALPNKRVDPKGVAFHFLEDADTGHKVLTGHDDGIITLNVAEADDSQREEVRTRMHEPYRTLLGHFRHEIGHYYWDRLVAGSPWLEQFREMFGDERADYCEALKRHYESPSSDWPATFISVYASSHPWEDWAECWAHYMHLWDGLETAASWGLRLDDAVPDTPTVRAQVVTPACADLKALVIEQWLPISQFSNAMSRSTGSHDAYPFVMPSPVLDKLQFIHQVVIASAQREAGAAPDVSSTMHAATTVEPVAATVAP